MDFKSFDAARCREALLSYDAVVKDLEKPNLVALDDFYRNKLPNLLHRRDPNPYITTEEISRLMEWKLARGKWRPRLLSFVSSLNDAVVKDASGKAFASLPDVSKAVGELTILKGVGPATASAVLAAYAPDVAPFMSDEATIAALGDAKDYSLKRYTMFVEKMQAKAKVLGVLAQVKTEKDQVDDSIQPVETAHRLFMEIQVSQKLVCGLESKLDVQAHGVKSVEEIQSELKMLERTFGRISWSFRKGNRETSGGLQQFESQAQSRN